MSRPHWQDWVTYSLGLWILGSPWFLEHSMMMTGSAGGGSRARWNLFLVGLAVVPLAIVAVEAFRAWEEWTNVALGAWLFASPWVLGFSASAALKWNAVIFGALVFVFAGWALVSDRRSKAVP
jgi:SPW repeat